MTAGPAAPVRRGKPYPESLPVAVLLTALVAFGPLSTDLYLPALPSLAVAFAADIATVQLTLSVFLFGFAVSQLAYGPLSDRFGRRPVALAGVGLFVAASIACALAPSIEALIACRFVQALGACAGPVLGRAIVRDVYGRERAARVLAYMAMAMALAPAIGPVLGGAITVRLGWRANFVVLTLFGAAVLAGLLTLLAETNRARDPLATRPRRLIANYATLLGHPAYLGYVLVMTGLYGGLFAFISGSAFVFVDTLGLSPDRYGLCFAAIVVGYMVGTFAAGRLTLRLGIDRLVLAGTLLAGLGGLAMLGLAAAGRLGVVAVVGPFFVYMVGAGLAMPNAIAGAIAPFPAMAGAASALLGFVQMAFAALVGIAVGHLVPAVVGTPYAALPMAAAAGGLALLAVLAQLALVRGAG